MNFCIEESYIIRFQKTLEISNDEFLLFKLNKEIEEFNNNIFNSAIENVAKNSNPIGLLLDTVKIEQIQKISNDKYEQEIKLRSTLITWSEISYFIRKYNKNNSDKIVSPFGELDFLLINVFGANLVQSDIPKNYLWKLRKLAEINPLLNCFYGNSNTKLENQLNIIFNIIEDKAGIAVGSVKARKRNPRLIRMEFLKYSSLLNNFNIVDVDRLIDLILRQYIYNSKQQAITTTSTMDIHKDIIPEFREKPQAIIAPHNITKSSNNEIYKIIQKTAITNPKFLSELYSEHRKTRLGIDVDYTIENIEEILKEEFIINSVRLWNTLMEYGEFGKSKYSACKHFSGGIKTIESYCNIAMYAPNGSIPIKECPSTLICILREYAWVPDKSGRLYKPADILPVELNDEFKISSNNLLITALEIGKNRN